jgi:O-antigen biosynthesis protein WbqP
MILKRLLDITFSLFLLIVMIGPLILIALIVRFTSPGPILHWSDRIGKNNKLFKMPKFRSMHIETPLIATHLLKDSVKQLTPIGDFLRKTSLDELPQLWSILVGKMSFVGPRPALFNQSDLISLRTSHGIHKIMPGLTGWAQINGRDNMSIIEKVNLDRIYLEQKSFLMDIKIIVLTFFKVLQREGVSH